MPFHWRKRRSPAPSSSRNERLAPRLLDTIRSAVSADAGGGVAGRPAGSRVPLRRRPAGAADVTIYVPTRRAARALRGAFVDHLGGRSAILPVVRPLGEFDEDEAAFDAEAASAIDLAPPIAAQERLLLLAPLVRLWKSHLPAAVAALSTRRSSSRPRPPMRSGWRATLRG
ncbi:hypothetical protein AJ88_02610 [Mesorhizobium amorphae CCBAU 01583]|nr:hypothetical protein AJ88_02610 [Mesorhizobium amorphae CCBAU 01583]